MRERSDKDGMDRLISEQAVLDVINKHLYAYTLIPQIKAIPSAEPRWIPVSERLPEKIGTYMTTIDYGKYGLATGQRFYHGTLGWEDDCVIAWMPLPKPYELQESEG